MRFFKFRDFDAVGKKRKKRLAHALKDFSLMKFRNFRFVFLKNGGERDGIIRRFIQAETAFVGFAAFFDDGRSARKFTKKSKRGFFRRNEEETGTETIGNAF